jgi:hypothetical protein
MMPLAEIKTEQIHQVDMGWSDIDQALAAIDTNHFKASSVIRTLLDTYSVEERKAIFKDFTSIKEKTFATAEKEHLFVLTSGGPGAGKSTHLETSLNFERDSSTKMLATTTGKFAYIDPDRHALFLMKETYLKDTRSPDKAYAYWRNASNFIAETLLATALKEGYAIAYGTTMTPPDFIIQKLMTSISSYYGYEIEMHHLSASDDLRVASIQEREKLGTVQTNEEDIRNKGKAFFERLPAYFQHVPKVLFFYRSDMETVTCAAIKTSSGIEIEDQKALDSVKQLHNTACGENYWETATNKK